MADFNENEHYAGIPENAIRLPFNLWTNPLFFRPADNLTNAREENLPQGNFYIVNGNFVRGNNTIAQHGLELNNDDFSDPGEYNVSNSPRANAITRRNVMYNTSYRKMPVKRKPVKTKSKTKTKPKAKNSTRNNRFGFKKMFGALGKGLKKLTGRSRKNRRS